jgi:hypothetical protein
MIAANIHDRALASFETSRVNVKRRAFLGMVDRAAA